MLLAARRTEERHSQRTSARATAGLDSWVTGCSSLGLFSSLLLPMSSSCPLRSVTTHPLDNPPASLMLSDLVHLHPLSYVLIVRDALLLTEKPSSWHPGCVVASSSQLCRPSSPGVSHSQSAAQEGLNSYGVAGSPRVWAQSAPVTTTAQCLCLVHLAPNPPPCCQNVRLPWLHPSSLPCLTLWSVSATGFFSPPETSFTFDCFLGAPYLFPTR